jgi:hypothetical protein
MPLMKRPTMPYGVQHYLWSFVSFSVSCGAPFDCGFQQNCHVCTKLNTNRDCWQSNYVVKPIYSTPVSDCNKAMNTIGSSTARPVLATVLVPFQTIRIHDSERTASTEPWDFVVRDSIWNRPWSSGDHRDEFLLGKGIDHSTH